MKPVLMSSFKVKALLLAMALLPVQIYAASRPNIVLVLLDDFGVGQFAPMAKHLSVEDISHEHLQYVASLGDKRYTPGTALEFSQRAMPTMDKLAESGVLFSNAFASSNLCAPSRQGILTARRHIQWGAYRNMDVNICGLPENSVLARVFQQAGYATGFIGKWHVGGKDQALRDAVLKRHGLDPDSESTAWDKRPDILREITQTGFNGSVVAGSHPLNNGFDYYFGYNRWECPFYDSELIWENHRYTGLQKQYNTDQFTDKAIQFMDSALSQDKPFFVEISYHAMHDPLDPLAPELYRQPFQSGNEYVDKYFSHLYAVDQNIQKVLDFLKQKKQLDQTMVVFTADNGATCTARSVLPGNAPHSGYKGSFRQGGFKVPLLIWYPQGIQRRGLVQQSVSTMDVLPTAIDLAGLTLPHNLDGKSLLPTLNSQSSEPVHDYLVWAGIHSRAWGFDYALNPDPPVTWRDRSPGSWVVIKDPYLLRYVGAIPADLHPDLPLGVSERYELYNIRKDPLELHNLYFAKPDKTQELTQLYRELSSQFPEPHYKGWHQNSWQPLLKR